MALIHRVKTTHCYSATPEHFQDFFGTLTQMYDDQTHTDVHLVAGDGTLFGVHRVRTIYIFISFTVRAELGRTGVMSLP